MVVLVRAGSWAWFMKGQEGARSLNIEYCIFEYRRRMQMGANGDDIEGRGNDGNEPMYLSLSVTEVRVRTVYALRLYISH